jgi:hypothetical protein
VRLLNGAQNNRETDMQFPNIRNMLYSPQANIFLDYTENLGGIRFGKIYPTSRQARRIRDSGQFPSPCARQTITV